jgi:hypothetical protein
MIERVGRLERRFAAAEMPHTPAPRSRATASFRSRPRARTGPTRPFQASGDRVRWDTWSSARNSLLDCPNYAAEDRDPGKGDKPANQPAPAAHCRRRFPRCHNRRAAVGAGGRDRDAGGCDPMRVIQKMDLWCMKHVVGMVLRDDERAKRGKTHRPQKVSETLYE